MIFTPFISFYKMKGKYQSKIVKLIFTQVLNIVGLDEKEILDKMSSMIVDNLKITGRWALRRLYKTLKSFAHTLENVAHFNPEIIAMYFIHDKNFHHFTSLDNIQRFLRICVDASKLADEVFEIVAHLLEPEDYKKQKDTFIVDVMEALDSRVPTDELREKFLNQKKEYLREHKKEAKEAIEKNKVFVINLFKHIARDNKTLKNGCSKLITLIEEVDVVQDFFFLDKQVSNSEDIVNVNLRNTNRPNRTTSGNDLGMALASALIKSANSSKASSKASSDVGDNKLDQIKQLQAQIAAMKK